MLYAEKLVAELERKRDLFTSYTARYGQQLEAYRSALAALALRFPNAAAMRGPLDALGDEAPTGASPTAEYDAWRHGGGRGIPVLPFGARFANHAEARAWAENLRGTVTFAVDGSQLMPWRDASVPVGLVQASIYENPHDPSAPYLKDVVTEVLAPEELMTGEPDIAFARTNEVAAYSERIVHLRRFELEVATVIRRMEHHAEHHAARRTEGHTAPVVALYDGSLIVSFALKMQPPYRERYAAAARRLLEASRRTRIPLVGYIDTSYARDTLTMLRALSPTENLPDVRGLTDALLWHGALGWGDRTPAFISARDDLASMGYDAGDDQVIFTYFQAAADRPPARLELPLWVLESGELPRVVDVVRGEAIVGNGYPYALESADAVAVITTEDRNRFYALFQQFAGRAELGFNISRKALSKSRRRV